MSNRMKLRRPAHVQIHFLKSYNGALPNRDDTGKSKILTFGGSVRTRLSSQSMSRRWRMTDDAFALSNIADAPASYRSRDTIDLLVMAPLYVEQIANSEVLDAIGSVLNINIYSLGGDEREHRQAMLLGHPEVLYLAHHARMIAEANQEDTEAATTAAKALFDEKEPDNFKAFRYNTKLAAGLEAALRGRMVTSDTRANVDGAISIAHAFTVHAAEHDDEFFTAVDDLHAMTDGPGAAMLEHTEITSGLYYGYVVADVKQLVSNTEGIAAADWLDGERAMAAQVLHNLIQIIATVSTAAKLGSTAAYSHASFMMVEIGESQPRTLSDAFRVPVNPTLEETLARLATHTDGFDTFIGQQMERRHGAIIEAPIPNSTQLASLSDIAMWVHDAVLHGMVE